MAQHLIHIGYPKAGSTFLQAWFECHTELRYRPGGLGGFHDVYEIARPTDEDYKYHVTSYEGFSMPQKSAGGLTLAYSGVEPDLEERTKDNQARVCSILKGLFPGSRVLIVTRGFKAMFVSGYSEYVRMGGVLHLKGMFQNLSSRIQDDTFNYHDFDYLIRLYADAFGEENLIVLPYELLRDDQNKFLNVIEEELGLKHTEVKLGRVNPSLSPEELYWYPLISRAVAASASRLGTARFRRIYTWYVGRTLKNRFRPLVSVLRRLRPDGRITDADFPEEILDYFKGKATLLKGRPFYAPYAAEYLLDEVP